MPRHAALDPLDNDLTGDHRALVEALRDLRAQVGQGVRAYARAHHRNEATVSRALGGKIIPTWEFVEELADHAAKARGAQAADPATIEYLQDLYNKALASSPRSGHLVQTLRRDLAQAQCDAKRAGERAGQLAERLQHAEERITDLDGQVRALENGQVRALPANTCAEISLARDKQSIRFSRETVEEDIAGLQIQFEEERKLKEEALDRCQDLEGLLAVARAELHKRTAAETDAYHRYFVDDEDDGLEATVTTSYAAEYVDTLHIEIAMLRERLHEMARQHHDLAHQHVELQHRYDALLSRLPEQAAGDKGATA